MSEVQTHARRMLSSKEVLALTNFKSRVTLWRRSRDPNDPFPAPVDTGNGIPGWYEDEIIEYQNTRPRIGKVA